MLCDLILLWDRLPLAPLSSSTSLARSILLFCESLLLSLENVWWSILLPQRSVVIKMESETLVLLSRENRNLHFRLKPQSLPFLWYVAQSNLTLLPCFWENDLMVRAVFYKKRNGQGDCIEKQYAWKQHMYFLHELLEQRRLLALGPRSSPQNSTLQPISAFAFCTVKVQPVEPIAFSILSSSVT